MTNRYRIVRYDSMNWRLERWEAGGRPTNLGPTREGWKGMESYHSNLKTAALALLDTAAGDALLAGEAQSILDALKLAEFRTLEALGRIGATKRAKVAVPE